MSTENISEIEITTPNDDKKDENKAEYSSTCSMFVTLLGFSLGMSDIWRFPFLVYRNGGGAFLIPFVITAVLCGVPLYFLEFSMSNFSGKGPYKIWEISPIFRGVGVSVAVAYIMYMVGTTVFRSWLAMFLLDSFKTPLPWTHCQNPWNTPTCRDNPFVMLSANTIIANFDNSSSSATTMPRTTAVNSSTGMTSAEEYWQFKALSLSSGMTDWSPILWKHILCMLLLRIVVFLSVVKSIKSIEKVMYVITFVPIIFQIVVTIRSLTLPGVGDGLYEFFYPDFSKLGNTKIWIEAFLMAFYTLGFGWGAILTLGSHGKFHDNCVRTSILIPVLDCLNAIFNGAVCFMVLGNMAHAYGVKVYDVIEAGFSAGVVTYVSALSILPVPQLWNFSFVLTGILLGLDNQIVPMEMILQILEEMNPSFYPKYRLHALTIVSILLFVLALPTCTGILEIFILLLLPSCAQLMGARAGGYLFLWVDWYTGVWIGPICAFTELIAVGWIYGIDRFSMDISLMTGKPAPWFFRVFIMFFAPVVVIVIFITACVEYVPPRYGSYVYPTWARGVGWLTVFCILSPIIIKAIHEVSKQTGSLKMKIKKSTKSTSEWGPKDREAKTIFNSQRPLSKNRSLGDMFYYIMIGNYRQNICVGQEKELSVFVDDNEN